MEKSNLLQFVDGGTISADRFNALEKALIEGEKAKDSFAVLQVKNSVEYFTKGEFESELVKQYRNLWLHEGENSAGAWKEYNEYYKLYRERCNELTKLKEEIRTAFQSKGLRSARKYILSILYK